MAVASAQVTVTVTATKLNTVAENDAVLGHSGVSLRNISPTSVYIGNGAVTASTGCVVPQWGTASVGLEAGEDLYAITASGTAEVHVIMNGV